MNSYDVAVIGTGPGGYVAAIRAAQRGARVAVVERQFVGGVCLNVGCIPSKTLIYSAELYRKMQHAAEYGLKASNVGFDLKALVARKNKVVGVNTGGIEALFKGHHIDVITGDARVAAPRRIQVGEQTVEAEVIILATGGRPVTVPGLEVNGKTVITSTEALELTKLPERIAVIGAGAVGAEFACVWNAFGAQVTLIEMLPRVLPREDEELTKRLGASLKKRGIDVREGTKVTKVTHGKKSVGLELEGKKPGSIEVDLVLVAVGFRCNSEVVSETPGLGVQIGPRGAIGVDDRLETAVPGLYAIGDVINKTWLAHGASAEGIVAATNATGGNRRMDYRVVPACTFTTPEVASVGLTEEAAKARGIEVRVGRFLFSGNGRAHAMSETEGLVKIIGDVRTDEVLGVHIMGHEAGEMIAAGALALRLEATVEELAGTIHTHPTMSEAMLEAAEDYYGLSIHTRPKAGAAGVSTAAGG
ncbi:MAG: dihydrolipoyl dehydrogenase [Candidatus Hydrogenedentes bacterium]|nr:dihydrolipoyl dehydrogenase [Candidatus Hydrogenedentota bacterium]